MLRRYAIPFLSAVVVVAGAIATWQQQRSAPVPAPASSPVSIPHTRDVPRDASPYDGASRTNAPAPSVIPAEDPFRSAEERDAVMKTVAIIRRGPPFPYRKDGSMFRNREGHLPRRDNGYYREFTVTTPGGDTRGARRIVAGERGELYYTRDHYASFIRLSLPESR